VCVQAAARAGVEAVQYRAWGMTREVNKNGSGG